MNDAERELTTVGRRQFGFEGAKNVSFIPKISVPANRLAFVAGFVADIKSRPEWAYAVNFKTTEKGEMLMAATDGISLGMAFHDEDTEWVTEAGKFNRSVPVDSFLPVLQLAAKEKNEYRRKIEIEFQAECAVFTFNTITASGKYLEDFPDYAAAIPKVKKPVDRVELNLDLLLKIRDAYTALKGKKSRENPILKCQFSGANMAILHRDTINKVEVVFMPCIAREETE